MMVTSSDSNRDNCCPTLHPLAGAHYRDSGAIGGDTIDVDLLRADHPIDVDRAPVCTLRVEFRRILSMYR